MNCDLNTHSQWEIQLPAGMKLIRNRQKEKNRKKWMRIRGKFIIRWWCWRKNRENILLSLNSSEIRAPPNGFSTLHLLSSLLTSWHNYNGNFEKIKLRWGESIKINPKRATDFNILVGPLTLIKISTCFLSLTFSKVTRLA